jgi:hypothetical protein
LASPSYSANYELAVIIEQHDRTEARVQHPLDSFRDTLQDAWEWFRSNERLPSTDESLKARRLHSKLFIESRRLDDLRRLVRNGKKKLFILCAEGCQTVAINIQNTGNSPIDDKRDRQLGAHLWPKGHVKRGKGYIVYAHGATRFSHLTHNSLAHTQSHIAHVLRATSLCDNDAQLLGRVPDYEREAPAGRTQLPHRFGKNALQDLLFVRGRVDEIRNAVERTQTPITVLGYVLPPAFAFCAGIHLSIGLLQLIPYMIGF